MKLLSIENYEINKGLGKKGFVLTLKPHSITEACQGRKMKTGTEAES